MCQTVFHQDLWFMRSTIFTLCRWRQVLHRRISQCWISYMDHFTSNHITSKVVVASTSSFINCISHSSRLLLFHLFFHCCIDALASVLRRRLGSVKLIIVNASASIWCITLRVVTHVAAKLHSVWCQTLSLFYWHVHSRTDECHDKFWTSELWTMLCTISTTSHLHCIVVVYPITRQSLCTLSP